MFFTERVRYEKNSIVVLCFIFCLLSFAGCSKDESITANNTVTEAPSEPTADPEPTSASEPTASETPTEAIASTAASEPTATIDSTDASDIDQTSETSSTAELEVTLEPTPVELPVLDIDITMDSDGSSTIDSSENVYYGSDDIKFISYGINDYRSYSSNSHSQYISAPYFIFSDEDCIYQESIDSLNSQFADKAKNDYSEMLKYVDEYNLGRSTDYICNYSLGVVRSDSRVFSAIVQHDEFCDVKNTESINMISTVNYDGTTGQSIKLNDFCSDIRAFCSIVSDELIKKYSISDPDNILEKRIYSLADSDKLDFIIGYGGVDIYFSKYLLTSADIMTVTVPFYGNEGIFADMYFEYPSSYTIKTMTGIPNFFDIDADGKMEEICIEKEVDSEGIYQLVINVNNETVNVVDYNTRYQDWHFETYLMHSENGNYLLVNGVDENSVCGLQEYQFCDNSFECKLDFSGNFSYLINDQIVNWTGEKDYASITEVNEPNSLKYDMRTDFVDTLAICINCYLDSDGRLQYYSNINPFVEQRIKPVLQDIKAYTFDLDGTIGYECTLSKGMNVYVYGVLNGASVILADEDYSQYYIVECDEYGKVKESDDYLYELLGSVSRFG